MAGCERALHRHIDCVKSFLRDSRTNNLPYTPGSGDVSSDRCWESRYTYFNCRRNPPARAGPEVQRDLVHAQERPIDSDHRAPAHGHMAGAGEAEHQFPISEGPRGPLACGPELNLYGMCVETAMRGAASRALGFHGVVQAQEMPDVEERCAPARLGFDKCMELHHEIEQGKRPDRSVEPWQSSKLANHFSVSGHW